MRNGSEQACQLLDGALDQLQDVWMFEEIASGGLRFATKAVEVNQWLIKNQEFAKGPPIVRREDADERAESQARWAKAEEKKEFPYLHGLLCIRIWAILDGVVDDLVALMLAEPTQCPGQEVVGRIKVPLVDFTAASAEQKSAIALQEYKRLLSAPLKPGLGRFETMLAPLGLGGAVDDLVRRTLLECSQARHVLVHRGGISDQRLVELCPWMNLKVGDPVEINHQQSTSFQVAADCYIYELDRRCRAHYSLPPNKWMEERLLEGPELLRSLRDAVKPPLQHTDIPPSEPSNLF